MKKIYVSVLFFWVSPAFALWSGSDITHEKLRLDLQIDQEGVSGMWEETITNTSDTAQKYQFFFPLTENQTVENLYVDMEGRGYEILEGEDRLNSLFTAAKTTENAKFFRFGDPEYPKLLISESIQVPSGKSKTLKLSFVGEGILEDDFRGWVLPLGDRETINTLEISILTPEDFPHLFTNLPEKDLYLQAGGNGLVRYFSAESYLSLEDIWFLWTEKEDPKLTFPYEGFTYKLQYSQAAKFTPKGLTILLDRSGSMSSGMWGRVEDILKGILPKIDPNIKIKIGTFAEDISWFSPEFRENDFSFREELFRFLNSVRPLGKTDLSQALENIYSDIDCEANPQDIRCPVGGQVQDAVLLITDNNEIPKTDFSHPIIVLGFSTDNNPLQTWTYQTGGWFLPLFHDALSFVESDLFFQHWHSWYKKLLPPSDSVVQDLVPNIIPSQTGKGIPFFVGRTQGVSSTKERSIASFLPRWWGVQNILDRFRRMETLASYQLDTEAILSIAQTMGVGMSFFGPNTKQEDFQRSLRTLDPQTWQQERWERRQFPLLPEKNIQFVQGIPYVQAEDSVWRTYDFYTQKSDWTDVEVAPFSEAQHQLFTEFPEWTAPSFALGSQVDFCTPVRCVSVKEGARSESKITDRWYWRDYNPDHWANGYVLPLIREGIFLPAQNGKLHLDRAVDRGSFSRMLVAKLWPQYRYRTILGIRYTDVPLESDYAGAVFTLTEKNIVQGYKDDTFRPLQSLTRAEAVKILLAADGYVPSTEEIPIFSDSTGWETPWVNEAYRRGIVKGWETSSGRVFKPHDPLTRAEAAKVIMELVGF